MVDKQELRLSSKDSLINIDKNTKTRGSETTKITRDKTEKGDSRISNKITRSFLEHEKAYLKNPQDYEKIVEETNSDANESLIKEGENKELVLNEPVRINLEIPLKNENAIKYVNIRITNKVTMLDILKQSINIFNDIFYREDIPFMLSSEIHNYSIKPSKKSGKPDNDLPKINLNNKVCDTNLKAFSIIYNKDDLMPVKIKEKGFLNCKNCLIF